MEVSSGPAPATPPPSAAPPPHGGDKPGQGGLDCPMEDRGVDLSFDLGTQVKREAGDQDPGPALKMEAASPAPAPSPAQSPGGRLKIFKEGRLVIELRGDGDRGKWVSAPSNKVYWPPAQQAALHSARLDSGNTNTGSEASVDTASVQSQPSPWAQSLPSPAPCPAPELPARQRRVKQAKPRRIADPAQEPRLREQLFAMKPSRGQAGYRRKIRGYRRRCRGPGQEIRINVFTMRLEINCAGGAGPHTRRRPRQLDGKVRAARLADLVSRLTQLKNRVHVPIAAWKQGRTDLTNLVRAPPSPRPPHSAPPPGAVRVKSELKLVTETCTASVTSVTASPKVANKVKAETRVVTAETRPVPVKSLPITPTIGRVKQELGDARAFKLSATSIMSPELARVKMEIGRDTHNYLGMRDDRDGGFVSPRKRLMRDQRDFEPGSPSAKHRRMSSEHRLSTDSVPSDRSSPYQGRAPHSPHRAPMSPAPGPALAMSPKPKVSFSIDSIMGGGAGPTMPPRPLPTTPSKLQLPPQLAQLRSPAMPHQPTPTRPRPPSSPAAARSPPPSAPAPASPFSPYLGYPGVHPLLGQDTRLLDPRLAQLAQLTAAGAQLAAADPRVSQLSDPRLTPGSAYPSPAYLLNHYMAAAAAAQAQAAAQVQAAASASPLSGLFAANSLAAGQAAAAAVSPAAAAAASQSSVWTPPVATTALTTPSPTPPPPRGSSPPPPTSTSRPSDLLRHPPTPTPVSSSSSKPPDIKYRGEAARFSKLFGDNDDAAPLNLSMKPTTL